MQKIITKTNFIEELEWRGMLNSTSPKLQELLNSKMITGYIGFVPTADFLFLV